MYAGLSFIPATLVGTASAKLVKDNRMSEVGDMMFYGADDKKIAMIEVEWVVLIQLLWVLSAQIRDF